MNVLLRKILINLSIIVFIAAFAISYLSGVPVLACFLRASISVLIVGFLGRFVLTNFLKDIAFALTEYEKNKKEEMKRQKEAEQEKNDSDETLYNNEEEMFEETYSEKNN